MIKKALFIAFIFILYGYRNQLSNDSNYLVIDLKPEYNSSINFKISKLNYSLSPLDYFSSLNHNVKNNYIGIPSNDSISFFGNFESTSQFYYDLYRDKEFSKVNFLEFINKHEIDTLSLSKKPLKQGFVSVVGFYKNKQFIIADANRNKDFSDDIKYEFNINFRKKALDSIEKINKLPFIDYTFENYSDGKIYTINKKIVLYPSTNESYLTEHAKFNKLEYLSKFRFIDYWKGSKIIGGKNIEFYYQGQDNRYGATFIKQKSTAFSKNDVTFNDQFIYYFGDTLTVARENYIIDSVNNKITKLYLRKINKNSNNYGSSIGSNLKNYVLKDIDGKNFNTNEIIKDKKYTLIDFWSTSCEPCIKMTPFLKKTYETNTSILNIISITNDKNINQVQNYIKKNNIPWKNSIITFKTPMAKDLKINYLPTLVLVNSKGKILYRGGNEKEFLKFIK